MKTTFKRKQNLTSADNNKIFFGHAQLDAILANNLKKGTLIVLEEDFPTSLYQQLLRYYIGSAYHVGETSLIFDIFA